MPVRLHAGRLDRRVVIEGPTASQGSEGGGIATFGTLATVWASIEPLRGREYFDAQTTLEETTARIIVRYDPDIDYAPEMRVVDGSDTWEIVSVLNVDTKDVTVEMMAVKRGD